MMDDEVAALVVDNGSGKSQRKYSTYTWCIYSALHWHKIDSSTNRQTDSIDFVRFCPILFDAGEFHV